MGRKTTVWIFQAKINGQTKYLARGLDMAKKGNVKRETRLILIARGQRTHGQLSISYRSYGS